MALKIIQDSVAGGISMVWDFDGGAITRKVVIGGVRSMMTGNASYADVIESAIATFNLQPGHMLNSNFMAWTCQADAMAGNDKLMLTIRYRMIDYVKVSLDGTVIRESTSLDSDGSVMKVDYNDNSGKVYSTCVASAEALRPGAVLEFEMFAPTNVRNSYQYIASGGAINSMPWQGCPAFTWLLTSLKKSHSFRFNGNKINGDTNVRYKPSYTPTKYSFQFYGWGTPKGGIGVVSDWRKVIMYKNWTLRQIHPNIDTSGIAMGQLDGNGWRRASLQKSIDFNQKADMNVSFPEVLW